MFEQINERQQEALFKKLLSRPENSFCADCKAKGASWTSMSYGVFICINCSGVHRSFGMQVTRVRSTKLDSWTKSDAKIMELVGNKIANLYWEHQIMFNKKGQSFNDDNKADYIKQKYVLKMFVKKGAKNPVDVVTERGFNISAEDLVDMYANEHQREVAPKTEKVARKKFEITKQPSNKQVEDIDLLNFDDNTKLASTKTNLSSKMDNKDLFDLDLKAESHSSITDSRPKQKHQNDDMFFLDLTADANHLRKVHSDVEDHKPSDSGANRIYNIHNVNIFNAPPTNVINSVNVQPPQQNDKYSVFDVYKLYNTPAYRY